jgi:WD repeat-containing protein 23
VYAHDNDVNTVCFADDAANIILTGSDDALIKVWDRRMLSAGTGDDDADGDGGVPAANAVHARPQGVLYGHRGGLYHLFFVLSSITCLAFAIKHQ